MGTHAGSRIRIIFGTAAVLFVMLAGLAIPANVGAETRANQSGPSDGQAFCGLVGGTEIPDGTFTQSGAFRHITCQLADGATILECTIIPGRLNNCSLR